MRFQLWAIVLDVTGTAPGAGLLRFRKVDEAGTLPGLLGMFDLAVNNPAVRVLFLYDDTPKTLVRLYP